MTIKIIEKTKIKQAVKVLQNLNEEYRRDSSKKKNLLEDNEDSSLFLQITLKKIPNSKSINMIKVRMPHSLLKSTDEVCLITGDLDKKNHKAELEPDILHYKELLEKHGITGISEIVTLRQLRTDYKPYEAKQQLLAAYDVFLADKKIAECLPKVLGKHFFKKRKFPIQIDLEYPHLKNQIENALSTKVFYLTGHGNSCCSEVAYLSMDNTDIIDNVMKVANTFCDKLPGSWNNIMGMYLKTSKSKAIPLFMSYDGFNDIKIENPPEITSIEGELSTLHNACVSVFSDGSVRLRRVNQKEENDETSLSQKEKTDNMEPTLTVSDEQQDKKSKKSKKEKNDNMETTLTVLDEQQVSQGKKRGKKSKKEKTDNMEPILTVLDEQQVSQEKKKSKKTKKVKTDNMEPILTVLDEQQVLQGGNIAKKGKKSNKEKTDNIVPILIVPDELEEESAPKSKKSKRKRIESESLANVKADTKNETPVQAMKKRKIEGQNMKKFNAIKEARKDKKKKKDKTNLKKSVKNDK